MVNPLDMPESLHKEVLDQLHEMGSDPSRPHNLGLYLYLPSAAAAKTAAEKVSRLHFATEVVPGDRGHVVVSGENQSYTTVSGTRRDRCLL